ncbi:MAG: cell wall hydrolase [Rhizobiales bacterium]|nr:cell wall hydrolase [Hyphomicrobiales bacterium]
MVVSRTRPRGAIRGSFGLTVLLAVLMPTSIGYQDLAALFARQPGVTERWRAHLMASPFGTIHAASFSFPRPVGTTIPQPIGYGLASLDRRSFEESQSIYGRIIVDRGIGDPLPPLQYPAVDRARKGDALSPRPQPKPEQTSPPTHQPQKRDGVADGAKPGGTNADLAPLADAEPSLPVDTESPAMRMARLFFGSEAVGTPKDAIEPWAPGEAPVVLDPRPHVDTEIKRSARLSEPAADDKEIDAEADKPGETVAGKGEVTGPGQRPKTPAERLGLQGRDRVKAERCLTNAIYFEARGEPERGQVAVAQVIMNRVFSGYYPGNVCGVVYQDSHRRLSCQFTFSCDGIPDVVNEADAWEVAKRIARETIDGEVWLPEVGKATHYHAYWVHPSWVREMRKLWRFGVHTFYRPLAWGDGADKPAWGTGAEVTGSIPKPKDASAKM